MTPLNRLLKPALALALALVPALALSLALAACEPRVEAAKRVGIDPENVVLSQDVPGSDIPVHLTYVETVDGLYTPIGIRKPAGDGPFPVILFASGNGGGGMAWILKATRDRGWTQEQFLAAGYAVVWLRYRAEVELGYATFGKLVIGKRQGRLLLNRGPLEYDDEITVIEYIKKLPWVDPERVGLVGLSHGGEMVLKVTSEYHGVAAAIASEPASHEFLALRPDHTATITKETQMRNLEQMQMPAAEKVRGRIDMEVAMARIATITTPILVHGREIDHLQGIFRATYELLREAGKDVEWKSYDHPDHGFIYPARNQAGDYAPDSVQREVVADSIAFFNKHLSVTKQGGGGS